MIIEYCTEGCGRFIYYSAGHHGRPDRSTKRYGGWAPGVQLAAGLGISAWQYRKWMEFCQRADVVAAFKLQEKQRRKAEAEKQPAPAATFQPPEHGTSIGKVG
jgi:hypothetical protein